MKKIALFLFFASPVLAQTKTDLSGAANLFDLTFTTQELDTLYSDVVDNLANYKAMHAISLNNSVPLSLWQNPKLPGMKFDQTQRPVVWPAVKATLPKNRNDLAFYSIDQSISASNQDQANHFGRINLFFYRANQETRRDLAMRD